jgi:hypothetical protein
MDGPHRRPVARAAAAKGLFAAEPRRDVSSPGPIYARQVLRELDPPIELLPAVRWYEALLARTACSVKSATAQTVTEDELSWLPAEQRAATRELLDAGRRLPQELIGTDFLESVSAG